MAIDAQRITEHRFEPIAHTYQARDAMLYALGLGLGADPLDSWDLGYLLEDRLKVLPTYAVTLASPGMWIRDPAFGVDFAKLVHSEQDATFHAPLPTSGTVTAKPRVASLTDRGAGKGAVLIVERDISSADGTTLASVRQTLLLRGDGGFGGPPPEVEATSVPQREPDEKVSIAISSRAALIYRLSGDWNPLHAYPDAAKAAGFERPILHGLASYGIAGAAIMRASGQSLKRLKCRFSGIVFPGDKLTLSLWREGDEISFQAFVGERRVLDHGKAILEN